MDFEMTENEKMLLKSILQRKKVSKRLIHILWIVQNIFFIGIIFLVFTFRTTRLFFIFMGIFILLYIISSITERKKRERLYNLIEKQNHIIKQ